MSELWSRNKGVYFGFGAVSYKGAPPDKAHPMRYIGDRHLVTVGPNGSGKSTRLLLPNLADLTGWSTLVIDPKGELALMTKGHREKHSRIILLNPFEALGMESHGFNPVLALDPDDVNFPDDAMGLAEAIIRVEGNEPHWSQSAQDLVCALIMYVRLVRTNPTLADVRSLLGLSSGELSALVAKDHFEHNGVTAPGIVAAAKVYQCEELAIKAKRFVDANADNKEIAGIISTALTQTRWLDSRQIKADLSNGSFDFSLMKREPITVYLILPANRLGTHSSWLRLMITSVLQPLMRDTRKPDVPVIFMLDEFAQLGHLPIIERTMAMMRGFGVKLWTVVQDLSQLKAIYDRHGYLSGELIDQAPDLPSNVAIKRKVGLMGQVHTFIGVPMPSHSELLRAAKARLTAHRGYSAASFPREKHFSQDYMIGRLKALRKEQGYLSTALIKADPTLPSVTTIIERFGSVMAAYKAAGWKIDRGKAASLRLLRRYKKRAQK